MSEEQTQELVEKQETDNALAVREDLGGDGFDDIDANDMVIPFLSLIQDNSPQRKKKHEKYVEGAEEGMILNTATDELYDADSGVMLIPVYIEKATVEWRPRNEDGTGGGFVAKHPWDHEDVKAQKAQGIHPKKWQTDEGNTLKQTYYLWCLILDPSNPDPDILDLTNYAIVAYESTKISVFSTWVTKAKKATETIDGKKKQIPLWRMCIRLGSKFVPKDPSYYNYTMNFVAPHSGEVTGWQGCILQENDVRVQAAEAFRKAILSGLATADTSSMEKADETDMGDTPF